jgi:hypothetical protein
VNSGTSSKIQGLRVESTAIIEGALARAGMDFRRAVILDFPRVVEYRSPSAGSPGDQS